MHFIKMNFIRSYTRTSLNKNICSNLLNMRELNLVELDSFNKINFESYNYQNMINSNTIQKKKENLKEL